VVRNIGREHAKALAQIFCKAEVTDLGAHAEPFVYQPFAAPADMEGSVFSRKDSGRDEDVPLSSPLFVLRGDGERQQDNQQNHENHFAHHYLHGLI